MLPEVKDGDDIGVVTKPSHGLSFTLDARSGFVIKLLSLYQSKGNIPV
jgi:hypothetical protein